VNQYLTCEAEDKVSSDASGNIIANFFQSIDVMHDAIGLHASE